MVMFLIFVVKLMVTNFKNVLIKTWQIGQHNTTSKIST